MAASVGGKGAALISTCEADTILRQSAPVIQYGILSNWQAKEKVAVSQHWLQKCVISSQHVLETRESKITSPELVQFIYQAAFAISCPIASLLAEVVIGRYKFISLLLRALWLLHITGVGISLSVDCLQIESTTSYMIGYYLGAVPPTGIQGAFLAVTIPQRERDEITRS